MKKVLSILLVLVLIAMIPMSAMAASKTEKLSFVNAWVKTANRGKLNVRSSMAAPANNLIAQLDYGTTVYLIDVIGEWADIQFVSNGKIREGFAMVRYLPAIDETDPDYQNRNKKTPSSKKDTETEAVTIDYSKFASVTPYTVVARPSRPTGWVNMRWAPSQKVAVMEQCHDGYPLTVIAQDKTWAQVQDTETGKVGFMMLKFLEVTGYGTQQ